MYMPLALLHFKYSLYIKNRIFSSQKGLLPPKKYTDLNHVNLSMHSSQFSRYKRGWQKLHSTKPFKKCWYVVVVLFFLVGAVNSWRRKRNRRCWRRRSRTERLVFFPWRFLLLSNAASGWWRLVRSRCSLICHETKSKNEKSETLQWWLAKAWHEMATVGHLGEFSHAFCSMSERRVLLLWPAVSSGRKCEKCRLKKSNVTRALFFPSSVPLLRNKGGEKP